MSTPTITAFGPLGTFSTEVGAGGYITSVNSGYIGFFSGNPSNVSNGFSEIDLEGFFTPTFAPQPIPIRVQGGALIWSCFAPLPCSEFQPAGSQNGPYGGGLLWNGTNTSAVYLVSTPEPGTLCLFALGALALGLVKKTLTP